MPLAYCTITIALPPAAGRRRGAGAGGAASTGAAPASALAAGRSLCGAARFAFGRAVARPGAVFLAGRASFGFLVLGIDPLRLRRHRVDPAPIAADLRILQLHEAVEGRLDDVVRVRGAERLREDVLHAGRFDHRAHRAPRDDTGPRRGRLEQDLPGAEDPQDRVRDGRPLQRNADEVPLGVLDPPGDRLRDLFRLPGAVADVAATVPDNDQRREAEILSALADLRQPVEMVHPTLHVET